MIPVHVAQEAELTVIYLKTTQQHHYLLSKGNQWHTGLTYLLLRTHKATVISLMSSLG